MRIIIIGSGWAGISAAIQAAKRGWQVTVVEERPYIGGRARSFRDKHTGHVIDNGQHVMIGAYTSAWSVMQTLGTTSLIKKQQALQVAFAHVSGSRALLDASAFPGKAGLLAAFLKRKDLSLASRLTCLRLAVRIQRKHTQPRGLTCLEFLQQEKQTPETIRQFWEPLILATLNAPVREAAAELLVNIMRLAFLGGKGASSLWLPTAGLTELIAPFPTWLSHHGGSVIVGTSVENLEFTNNSDCKADHGVNITLSNRQQLNADAVVAAIPQRALQRLLQTSDLSLNLPEQPSVSPIVSVYLWYDHTWLTTDFTATLGTSIQWVFNKSAIHPGLVALTVSAAEQEATLSGNDLVTKYDTELRTLFPEMKQAVLLHSQVIKEKHATPLITPAVEAQKQQIGLNNTKQLVIAGDWTVPGLPATIEAAARSGVQAVATLAHLSTNE